MNSAHLETYKEYGRRIKRAFSGMFGSNKRRRISGRRGPMSRTVRSSSGNRQFGKGFYLVNRRATNVKRRYRKSKRSRIVRLKRRKVKMAGVAGKLLAKMWKRMVYLTERANGVGIQSRGSVAMPNIIYDNAGIDNSRWHFMPLIMFDITNVNTGTTAHNVAHQLVVNRSPGAPSDGMQFRFLESGYIKNSADGEVLSDTYSYTAFKADNAFSSLDNSRYDQAEKVYQHGSVADLLLYGQKGIDTHYRIDVVQFDPKFVEWLSNPGSATADPDVQDKSHAPSFGDWRQFWHSMLSPYTQNPLVKRYRGKFMKVLKSYKFDIPEQSNDYEQIPCVKTRIRIPMNRVRDRIWHRGTDTDLTTTDPERHQNLNSDNYDSVSPANQVTPINVIRPKDRVYLMIRANSVNQVTDISTLTTEIPAGNCPTFDISLRSTFTVI